MMSSDGTTSSVSSSSSASEHHAAHAPDMPGAVHSPHGVDGSRQRGRSQPALRRHNSVKDMGAGPPASAQQVVGYASNQVQDARGRGVYASTERTVSSTAYSGYQEPPSPKVTGTSLGGIPARYLSDSDTSNAAARGEMRLDGVAEDSATGLSHKSKRHMRSSGSMRGSTTLVRSRDDEGASARDDGRSSASGSSSASKALIKLRKALGDSNNRLLPGLAYLKFVGLAITVLAIGLAIGIATIMSASFLDYRDNVEYVRNGAVRIMTTFSTIVSMQDLVYSARGWTSASPAQQQVWRSNIIDNITLFTNLHRNMYAHSLNQGAEVCYARALVQCARNAQCTTRTSANRCCTARCRQSTCADT